MVENIKIFVSLHSIHCILGLDIALDTCLDMCAIFQLSFEDIKEIKNMADEITKKYENEAAEQCFNVDLYPKSTALVLGPQKKGTLMKWGFPMRGSSNVVFIARAESLNEKSMFRSSLANRCLIPATSFYEWSKEKKKYRIKTEPSRMIYMAALWKPYLYQGNKVYCFTKIYQIRTFLILCLSMGYSVASSKNDVSNVPV